jgi:hypothetical protein
MAAATNRRTPRLLMYIFDKFENGPIHLPIEIKNIKNSVVEHRAAQLFCGFPRSGPARGHIWG